MIDTKPDQFIRRSPCQLASEAVLALAMGMAGLAGSPLAAQTPTAAQWQQLQQQVTELAQALHVTQAELAATQAEVKTLQQQVVASSVPAALDQRLTAVEDQQAIVVGKIDDQEQTKVASGSRFQTTLSGMLLLNAFDDQGTPNDADVPNLAFAAAAPFTAGSLGASLRQSEISLQVSGTQWAGARASGEIIADFFGGLPNYLDGDAAGVARLKIARGRLDWQSNSITFGLDKPLISPRSPTSYASLAVPALGYSGNLWTWTPQIAAEHRWKLNANWNGTLQAGLLDPLDGEFPARTNFRSPEAGEASRQPAFELHQEIGTTRFDRPLAIGVGAYSGRQNYGFGRGIRSWAVTGDWQLALAHWLDLTGEAFRGQGLGGLWGGIGSSIVASSATLNLATTQIVPLRDAGGWGQLTVHFSPQVDLNAAYGLDNPFAADLGRFGGLNAANPLARNHTGLVNLIERPRSDLIFAEEYRRIETWRLTTQAQVAAQLSASLAVIF